MLARALAKPVQPAGARRAHQRSRPRNAGPAAGDGRRLSRHRPPGQPRPRLPRPHGHLDAGRRGRRPLGRICRRLFRHAGAARRARRAGTAEEAAPAATAQAAAAAPSPRRSKSSPSRTSTRWRRCRRRSTALHAEMRPAAGAIGRPGPVFGRDAAAFDRTASPTSSAPRPSSPRPRRNGCGWSFCGKPWKDRLTRPARGKSAAARGGAVRLFNLLTRCVFSVISLALMVLSAGLIVYAGIQLIAVFRTPEADIGPACSNWSATW